MRLRLAELAEALAAGRAADAGDLATRARAEVPRALGITRHDARADTSAAIVMSGRAQGLFDAIDEVRVVIVENADALDAGALLAEFPADAALILVTQERIAARAARAPARARAPRADTAAPVPLPRAVEAAGGRVERIDRLAPEELPRWISSRAALHGTSLEPDAVVALAAVGPDSARIETELAKLAAYAAGRRVTAADVAQLVSGAIESDVFALTQAVVRRDTRAAVETLERLLANGHAAQQILAMLVWQFRVLLFASAMRNSDDAVRMAKAIRSTPGAIGRWQAWAKGVSRAQVTSAYESLYATDLAIKQGRIDAGTRADADAMALMFCVLDLCGVANADPRTLIVGEPPKR